MEQASFLRDVPRLIVEHNIYGVDIDPRAAQIASLALWLRAQRAWHAADVRAKDRPLIGRGHVVAAIAPPAERELRQQFIGELDHLDAELFEKTLQLLKGLPELGVLLQVERELPSLIRQVFGAHGSLFKDADMEQWQLRTLGVSLLSWAAMGAGIVFSWLDWRELRRRGGCRRRSTGRGRSSRCWAGERRST